MSRYQPPKLLLPLIWFIIRVWWAFLSLLGSETLIGNKSVIYVSNFVSTRESHFADFIDLQVFLRDLALLCVGKVVEWKKMKTIYFLCPLMTAFSSSSFRGTNAKKAFQTPFTQQISSPYMKAVKSRNNLMCQLRQRKLGQTQASSKSICCPNYKLNVFKFCRLQKS